jgi:hypothetical protein
MRLLQVPGFMPGRDEKEETFLMAVTFEVNDDFFCQK